MKILIFYIGQADRACIYLDIYSILFNRLNKFRPKISSQDFGCLGHSNYSRGDKLD